MAEGQYFNGKRWVSREEMIATRRGIQPSRRSVQAPRPPKPKETTNAAR